MARPPKEGLDYFPLDTANDDKLDLIEAKHGLAGFAVIIKLWQMAYKSHGYFYEWNEREQLLFSKRVNVDINSLDEIIKSAMLFDLFDADIFGQYHVLTSRGMQKRFICACSRRKGLTVFSDFWIVNADNNPDNADSNTLQIEFMPYNNPYIKVKDIKVNNTTEIPQKREAKKAPIKQGYTESFNAFWESYPRREGKGQAAKVYNLKIKQGITPDEIQARLSVYKAQIEAAGTLPQYIRHPGTFLNNIDDYPEEARPKPNEPLNECLPYREKLEHVTLTQEEREMIARSYGVAQ